MGKKPPTTGKIIATWGTGRRMSRLLYRLLVSPHPLHASTILDELSIDDRTLRRYITELNDELGQVEGEGNLIKVDKPDIGVKLLSIPLFPARKVERILAAYFNLHLIELLSAQLGNTPISRTIDNLKMKTAESAGKNQKLDLKNFKRKCLVIPVGRKEYTGKDRVIEGLLNALHRQYAISFLYKSPYSEESYRHGIDPYSLVLYREGLYLLGRHRDYDELMVFAVERMSDLKNTRMNFDYPSDYDPRRHFEGSFGIIATRNKLQTVRVRIADQVTAKLIRERHWHDSVRYEETGGTVVMTLELGTFDEFVNWILGFGRHVEVLEPAELRARVAAELEAAAEVYRRKRHPAAPT